jgi:hypothetical protein
MAAFKHPAAEHGQSLVRITAISALYGTSGALSEV